MTEPTEKQDGQQVSIPPQLPIKEIELDDPAPTDDTVEKALHALGLVKMTKQKIKAFQDCGAFFKGRGIIKNIRGESFVARHLLLQTMGELAARVKTEEVPEGQKRPRVASVDELCSVTHALAVGLSKITESQKMIIRMEPAGKLAAEEDQNAPPTKSLNPTFPASVNVIINGNNTEAAPKARYVSDRSVIGDVKKVVDVGSPPA